MENHTRPAMLTFCLGIAARLSSEDWSGRVGQRGHRRRNQVLAGRGGRIRGLVLGGLEWYFKVWPSRSDAFR
jgi:hypothetical protein